jgi:hypothetical protein
MYTLFHGLYILVVLTNEFLFPTLDGSPSADVCFIFHVHEVENG